ncbi:uncharacterized protein LY89DRAFT_601538 [Mollisia scopiformis]|uniref:Myb-like domain-containing protein n=1 Tax=Mollisia scopiformis TaxID=149040 RepID=A0A132B5Z9_MOLSC|nr:uncharacterized protein LY89DRAFT_601538 [Mollisia scopiformis]KUJ07314.1 hypothetical protein LY89DRAFT_601538 [Mollisia scopiformis]
MNNTIEPRLIALLNEAPAELYTSPSLELPPLHDPNILKASGRPLLLEPDASKRNGKPNSNPQLAPKHNSLLNPIDDDEKRHKEKRSGDGGERALGVSSPQSLRKILDDDTDASVSASTKKRPVVEPAKDEFVQLPQPPKKQKTAKQVVPPIIIGLFEPPPQATLFPPIASSSFHDSHGRNSLNTVPPKIKVAKESTRPDSNKHPEKDEPQEKSFKRRKSAPGRNKWTDEETSTLLLGVAKHGIGNWTDIIKDPSFSFNQRSALDLKDRFRTCCPDELRGKKGTATNSKTDRTKAKSSLMSQNILIGEEDQAQGSNDGDLASSRHQKTRAHRKKLEDLAQLGIKSEVPFKPSDRRERRPYTEEEDRAILEGYKKYGFVWSQIQRDPQFNLQSRQPTDIRDRFRNKYPEKFKKEAEAKKKISVPDRLTSSSQQPNNGATGKEESVSGPSMDASDSLPYSQSFDWNSSIAAPFYNNSGEMDISRLLLDETWPDIPSSSGKEKQSFTDLNSIMNTSSAEPVHNGPSFFNLLNDPDQIEDINDSSFG